MHDNEKTILDFIKQHTLAVIKYENLRSNPQTAFVIGWDNDITVQYEGIAIELKGEELKECQNIHVTKLPKAKKFMDTDVIRHFKVVPKWIRYSDLSASPWKVFEVKF